MVGDEGNGCGCDIVWHGTMSGAVSWSAEALLVAAKVMPVQVVWINSGFATPER